MAKKTKTTGAPTEFLELLWGAAQKATEHSWQRLNTSMGKGLTLAIGSGMEFCKGDFEGLGEFRSGYWMGDSDEWCYSLAITEGNLSAAVAYEQWKGREPIIADSVTPAERYDRFAQKSGSRDQERLHVGCYFQWQGERVKVTSFTKDGAAIAVAYKPAEGQYDHERKVKKRFTITRELVIQDRAERKQRETITQELIELYKANKTLDFKTEFGVTTTKELDAMPFKKFVKIADAIKAKAA